MPVAKWRSVALVAAVVLAACRSGSHGPHDGGGGDGATGGVGGSDAGGALDATAGGNGADAPAGLDTAGETTPDALADAAPEAAPDAIGADATTAVCTPHAVQDAGIGPGIGADAGAATVYSALGDLSKWSQFNLASIGTNDTRFTGGTFDGRYAYFASATTLYGVPGQLFARHDTGATFTSTASWETITPAAIGVPAMNFAGALFDGRYVYYVPINDGVLGNPTPMSTVVRFDTRGDFTNTACWSRHDAPAAGFFGGVFDGRYLYFVPTTGTTTARFDTQGDFASPAAWTQIDLAALDPANSHFHGGVFDGRYVYYVPYGNPGSGAPTVPGFVARYDTTAPFADVASWSKFGLTNVKSGAIGYVGAVFDGRYVHFVPYWDAQGTAIRYDTHGTFTDVASWSQFSVSTVNSSLLLTAYMFGAFDGRYVTFIPYNSAGNVVRYDTQASYTDPASWSVVGLVAGGLNAAGFEGAVFSGEFLYLVPWVPGSASRWMMRFDAKTPPALPSLPAHHGSFF